MRRRKICLAAILAAVMALQAPVTAFAEETAQQTTPEPETYGDVTITDDGWKLDSESDSMYQVGSWEEGGVTTVGNVTSTVARDTKDENGADNLSAVAADQGTVQVNGNVSSANTSAVSAENSGTVKVTGSVTSGVEDGSTVNATGGSTVEVGGNVTNTGTGTDNGNSYGTSNGIWVEGQSTVKVGGDVTVSSGTGIIVNSEESTDRGQVAVDGSVSSAKDTAIITNAASEIAVGENVTGNTGIVIRLNGAGGKVEVLGTVKSTTDKASVIVVDTEKTDKDEIVSALPEIVVGSLEGAAGSPDDFLWIGGENNKNVGDEAYEAVYQQILYYIAQDKFANATLSVAGADTYKNGYTSKEGNTLTVTITTADGYEVSSVSGTSVVKNADGTYTVVVQRGKGIDINAVISAIQRAISGSTDDTPVIVIPAYAATQKRFQEAIAAQLKILPAGGTLTLDMKDCISFNKKTFEVLSQRNDVDIEIIYTWKGKKYLVVIPAGYDILSLLDANGYCGCLYLNSIFGSTELTK